MTKETIVFNLQGDAAQAVEGRDVITYVSQDGYKTVSFSYGKRAFTWNVHSATNTSKEIVNKLIDLYCCAIMEGESDLDTQNHIKQLKIN